MNITASILDKLHRGTGGGENTRTNRDGNSVFWFRIGKTFLGVRNFNIATLSGDTKTLCAQSDSSSHSDSMPTLAQQSDGSSDGSSASSSASDLPGIPGLTCMDDNSSRWTVMDEGHLSWHSKLV